MNKQQKIQSEEENIDSFDVNPKSGRWNVIQDTNTDDLITDSSLRLITTNNGTSGGKAFDMDRGMRKSDGKFEYRLKNEGGGNQTEYFRDELGDSADFEEGDVEGLTNYVRCSSSVQNGRLVLSPLSSYINMECNFNLNSVSAYIYSKVELLISGNVNDIQFDLENGARGQISGTYILNTTQTLLSIDLDSDWTGKQDVLSITFDEPVSMGDGVMESTDRIYIDEIKLIGNLDYATHVNGEIEDTWDFEDSNEYFHKEESNISDFDDGTTEDWTALFGGSVSQNAGYLNITDDLGTVAGTTRSGLSISASTYSWMTIEFESNQTVTQIEISESGSLAVCVDSTGWSAGSLNLFSCDLSLDGDWGGTETQLYILFTTTTPVNIGLNFTFLYDVALGDLEDWGQLERNYVNPNGWITGGMTGSFDELRLGSFQTILTDNFDYLKIRMDTNSDFTFRVLGQDQDDSLHFLDSGETNLTKAWTTYTINLSATIEWTDETYFKLITVRFTDESGNFEGEELIHFDYFLVLGHWAASDAVLGLMNPTTKAPLVNITTHFFDQPNDPNYPNNNSVPTFRYEIELLDESGEVAYSYLSNNFTDLGEGWIRAIVTYDVLQSKFIMEIRADNNTRIFRKVFPGDFTNQTGRTPALFNLGQSPSLFVSSYTAPMSWQVLRIDFIEAPFKENQWRQIHQPTDPDWLQDNYDVAYFQDNIGTENSTWRINVPNLDSVSASLRIQTGEYGDYDVLSTLDRYHAEFNLYAVDKSDGELHKLAEVFIQIQRDGSLAVFRTIIIRNGTDSALFTLSQQDSIDLGLGNPKVEFSMSLQEDRSILKILGTGWVNDNDSSAVVSGVGVFDIASITADYSQEFVLETYYSVSQFNGDQEVLTTLGGFDFVERELFQGDGGTVGPADPSSPDSLNWGMFNWLGDIIIGLFRFLAGIFKFVGDALGDVFDFIIDGLGILLEAAINLVEDAIDLVWDIIDLVLTEITKIWNLLSSFIVDILAAIVSWFTDDFIPWIIDLLFSIWDDIIVTVVGFISADALELVHAVGQADYVGMITEFLNLWNYIGIIIYGLFVIITIFIFTWPAITHKGQAEPSMRGIGRNAGRTFDTPSILGFQFKIALIIIWYIWSKILIIGGTLPNFFAEMGLPI